MKCSKCGFENLEEMKFCGKCGGKIQNPCWQCGFLNPSEYEFCGECGVDLKKPAKTKPLDLTQPQKYTPKFLAEKILTSRSNIQGERKVVTVFFADVANFTSLSEKLDPEEVHQIMDGCFKILMDAIHRYEGTINQFTGDGVMALFGAPIAHEDHAQRACYAALAIQRDLAEYERKVERDSGLPFKMRIGLNSGLVIVGSIGDDLRMDYTAVGDTTNLASRMQGLAKPGSILVSRDTQRLTRDFFEFTPLGELSIKGKEEPQEAFELIQVGGVDTRIKAAVARGLTRFLGRDREKAVLTEAFEQARSGSGQIVAIVGEAGVGKSRLLFEFIRGMEQDFTYLEGRCIHYGETLPYYPFIEIVKHYCGIEEADREFLYRKKLKDKVLGLDPGLENILPFLEDLLSLKVEDQAFSRMKPEQRKWNTIDGIRTLLIQESQRRPFVLAVEDMHWIDKSSEELLTHLIEGLARSRILLLCLYRPEYRHRWGELSYYSRLGLDQLTPVSSAKLLEAILEEGKVADDLKDLVLGKAGGNPLFVEEFTRNLLDIGAIGRPDDRYILTRKPADIDVPDTLQAVIAARVDRLEETLKQVLQVASVIGRDFAFKVLKGILEMGDELRRYLANLQGLEFIYEKALSPEIEYVFKHGLTQEVAYNSLLHQRRKEFHRRAAEAMEKLYRDRLYDYSGPLAYHYYRAEEWDRAFEYLVAAGERARAAYAIREAIDYLDKAIEVSGRMTSEVDIRQMMSLYAGRGKAWRVLSEYEKAIPDFERCAEIARQLGEKRQEARALEDTAMCSYWLREGEKYSRYLEQAVHIYRETGDIRQEMASRVGAAMASGSFTEAVAIMEQGVDFSRQLGDRKGLGLSLCFLAVFYNFKGEFETCIKAGEESAEIAQGWGNRFLLVTVLHYLMLGYTGRGEYDEALRKLDEVAKLAPVAGGRRFVSLVPNHYGWIYNELCNFEKAIGYDQTGLSISQRYEEPECEIFSLLNLANDYIGLGQFEKASSFLEEVRKRSDSKYYRDRQWRYEMHLVRYRSQVALAREEYDEAMTFAQETLARGETIGAKKYIAFGWELKGRVLMAKDRLQEAEECFVKSRDFADQMGYPPLKWETRYFMGQLHKRQNEPDAAKRELEEAIAVIQQMASKVSDKEVRETFLSSKPVQAVYDELQRL